MDKDEKEEIKNLISFDNVDKNSDETYEITENSPISDKNTDEILVCDETDAEKTQFFDITSEVEEDFSDMEEFAPQTELIEDEEEFSDGDDFEFDEDDEYNEKSENEESVPKKCKPIKRIIILLLIIILVIIFVVTDTGFIGTYKRNFSRNFEKITGITLMEEKEEDVTSETIENIEDYRKVMESYGLEEEVPVPEEQISEESEVQEPPQAEQQAVETEYTEDETIKYNTTVKSSMIIPYEYANESVYSAYSKGIICASTNYMCYINTKGEKEWEMVTSVIDPILRTAGEYVLIAQKNGRKLCLYNNDELIYDIDCEDNILTAGLSEKGDCVLVTTKDLYKGAVVAYNRNGKLIYAWSSGTDSVIDAAISPKTRNIAVALLNTEETVESAVEIFDITETVPLSRTVYEDTILFDVEYRSDTIYAFGDNSIVGVKGNGKTIFDVRFDGMNINHYAFDDKGNSLMLVDNANVATLANYNASGKNKHAFSVLSLPDYVAIDGRHIMYNMDRDVILGKTNGRGLSKFTASMDIHGLIMIDKDTFFIVYSNSLELVEM